MSTSRPELTLRLLLKLAQFLASLYLVYSLYSIGPHWMLLFASLAVPLFGLFLLFRSPERTLRPHSLPYARYKALANARSWLRVDLAICATMAVVCMAFSVVLLIGYLQQHSANSFLLQAAVAALLLFLLYSVNALLSVRQLQMGQVDFLIEKRDSSIATTRSSSRSPLDGALHSPPLPLPPPPLLQNGQNTTAKAFYGQLAPDARSNEGQTLLEQLRSEFANEPSPEGRWRQIPITRKSPEEVEGTVRVERRRVRLEKRKTTPQGIDFGSFGSRQERCTAVGSNEVFVEGGESGCGKGVERLTPLETNHSSEGILLEGRSEVPSWSGEQPLLVGASKMGLLPRLAIARNGEMKVTGKWPSPERTNREGTDNERRGRSGSRNFDVQIRSRSNPPSSAEPIKVRADGTRWAHRQHQVTELAAVPYPSMETRSKPSSDILEVPSIDSRHLPIKTCSISLPKNA